MISIFPIAFVKGMKIAQDGEETTAVSEEKRGGAVTAGNAVKPRPQTGRRTVGKKVSDRNKYAYWEQEYPECVIVKKEGAFWTTRGESAVKLSSVTGFKLGEGKNPVTGSPNLPPIIAALEENKIKYIVVENGEVIKEAD